MPPHHTHLENRFFENKYIQLLQDSIPLILSCRNVKLRSHIPCQNVTLRSHNIVSERDTPIQLSHYFISASLLYSRRHFNRESSRLEIQHSHNFRQPQTTQSNTQETLQYHSIHINRYLEFIYQIEINHNLPPPKNRSQVSSNTFYFLNTSLTFPIYLVYIFIQCQLTIL